MWYFGLCVCIVLILEISFEFLIFILSFKNGFCVLNDLGNVRVVYKNEYVLVVGIIDKILGEV